MPPSITLRPKLSPNIFEIFVNLYQLRHSITIFLIYIFPNSLIYLFRNFHPSGEKGTGKNKPKDAKMIF